MIILGKELNKKVILKMAGIFAAGLVVLGVAGYMFLIQREKSQFAQAEKEIDALYAQIVEKVGKPDQEKKEKTCDRPNLKYAKGPLSCSINTYLLYEGKDLQTANELLGKISVLGTEALRIGSAAAKGSNFNETTREDWDQRFFQHFSSGTPLSCNFSYTYPSVEQEVFKLTSKKAVMVGVGCYRSAMSEYFPRKD